MKTKCKVTYAKTHKSAKAARAHTNKIKKRGGKVQTSITGKNKIHLTYSFK